MDLCDYYLLLNGLIISHTLVKKINGKLGIPWSISEFDIAHAMWVLGCVCSLLIGFIHGPFDYSLWVGYVVGMSSTYILKTFDVLMIGWIDIFFVCFSNRVKFLVVCKQSLVVLF